jgi:hypothetical protein
MAPRHALAAFLSFVATASAQYDFSDEYTSTSSLKTSMFWTATQRFAQMVTVSTYTRGASTATPLFYTYTVTRTVKPTITPTATPISTSTYTQSYNDLKYIYQFYAAGVVPQSDLVPESTYDSSATTTSTTTSTSITLYMPVTMTAPASCSTQFSVTTTATVSVPSAVLPQLKPTSTVDGGLTTRGSGGYVYSYQTWWLSADAAPFTTSSDYNYRYYIRSCSVPPRARSSTTSSSRIGGGSGGGGSTNSNGSSRSSYAACYRYSYYCGSTFKVWIIIIATVIPGLFLLGILESWFWFRRLMCGKSAMRFGTVSWVLISLWVLCFTRMQDARSKEDQVILQEKWKAMGTGAALKAWLKWALRHKYPVEYLGQYSRQTVGIVPAGEVLDPVMAQKNNPDMASGAMPPPTAPGQVYYYGPPPGWLPTPDGQGFMPPPGYVYPPPQSAEYYAPEMTKAGMTAQTSPVEPQQQHSAFGLPQHTPVSPMSTPPPHTQAPPQAPLPQAPPPVDPAHGPPSAPPQAPPPPVPQINVSEASATPARPAPPPPAKNAPNDRSLYE